MVCPTLLSSQEKWRHSHSICGRPCEAGKAAELPGKALSSHRLPGHKSSDVPVYFLLCVQVLLGEEAIWAGAALMALPAAAGCGQLRCLTLCTLQPRAVRALPKACPDCRYVAQLHHAGVFTSSGRGMVPAWPVAIVRSWRSCGSLQWTLHFPKIVCVFGFE